MSDRFVNVKNGLRAALAIAFAVWLCHLLRIHYGYWIILTVMVVIQPSVGATLERAKLRVLGTLLGVLIGAFLIAMLHGHELLIFAALLILIFFALWLMFINYVWAIFYATAALILILGAKVSNPWVFVSERFYDTIIGVAIGLLFSLVLWPSWARLRFRENILQSLRQVRELSNMVLEALLSDEVDRKKINELRLGVGEMLEKNRQFFSETRYEGFAVGSKKFCAQAILESLEQIRDIMFALHGLYSTDLKIHEEEQIGYYISQYREVVDTRFAEFISFLTATEKERQPLSVINYPGEMPLTDASYSQLYLQRVLDRIFYELNHLQQALIKFNFKE